MKKYLQGFVAATMLCFLTAGGWSSRQVLTGEYKTIQQVDDADVIYFPRKYSSTQTVREVHNKDSSTAVTYASIARKSGTGLGQFVFFSRSYVANKETVYVGDISYQYSGGAYGLDSVTVINLSGSTFQIEGAK